MSPIENSIDEDTRIHTDNYYYSPGKSKTRRKRCQVKIGVESRARVSHALVAIEGRRGGRERERGGKRSGGGGGGRFVQAIFCFSLPTALAEYSRAILGPNVN